MLNNCYLNERTIDVEKRSVTSVFAAVDRCGQNLFLLLCRYCKKGCLGKISLNRWNKNVNRE
jgi:hypothetical protein